jgi:hypothetical protein
MKTTNLNRALSQFSLLAIVVALLSSGVLACSGAPGGEGDPSSSASTSSEPSTGSSGDHPGAGDDPSGNLPPADVRGANGDPLIWQHPHGERNLPK